MLFLKKLRVLPGPSVKREPCTCASVTSLVSSMRTSPLSPCFPREAHPARAPWRLMLVCIFQFIEGLTDRQAAEAVQQRIDWKYALALELSDPGFNFSVLSKFRARVVAAGCERELFEIMLDTLKAHGLLKARGRQRSDSTHILAAVR